MSAPAKHKIRIRSGRPQSVLLADGDNDTCKLARTYLEKEGFIVDSVDDGEAAIERALLGDYRIGVLDIMLPGLRGFELLRRFRASSRMPVLITTTRSEDVDRIIALEVGADDYLSKPYNPRELVARIRAVLRRVRSAVSAETLCCSRISALDIEMDISARIVVRAGQLVDLTTTEFELLRILIQNAGRVVSRADLARSVFGLSLSQLDRRIDLHVSHLRRKLGRHSAGPERIKAIRGTGYLYALPIERARAASSA